MVRKPLQWFGEAERPEFSSIVQRGNEAGIEEMAVERRGWMWEDFRGKIFQV